MRYAYQYTENPALIFTHTINQRRLDFNSDFNNPGGLTNFRPEVVANYSLFRGGQDYQTSLDAELGIEAATLEKSAIRNSLTQAVMSGYYGYLAAREAYKVTLNSIKAVASELEQSQIRYEAGVLLKSDLLSLKVQLAEAKDAKIRAENSIELAKTGLKTLLGLRMNLQKSVGSWVLAQALDSTALQKNTRLTEWVKLRFFQSTVKPIAFTIIPRPTDLSRMNQTFNITNTFEWQLPQKKPEFDEILLLAIEQRPEIQAANKQIEIQQHLINAAKGAHLPRANAYISYGQDSRDGSFSSNRDHFTAVVNVEMDVFSGFSTSERINKAKSKLIEIQEIKRRILLNIENEVKTVYLRFQEALARVDIATSAIASAQEAARMVKEQRQTGIVTVTRYIESEVAKDKAHSRAIAAQFDALRSEAELNKAQGLWK